MNAISELTATPEATNIITGEVARLATAVDNAISRDFAVLTCEPRDKRPWPRYSPNAVNSATKDKDLAGKPYNDGQIANFGVACGQSDLAVVDIDHGLNSAEELDAWMVKNNLPPTLAVRTGRRTEYGIHLYYRGAVPQTTFELDGCKGEIKSFGGYILGVGSRHPISGELYEYLNDNPIAPLPEVFKTGKTKTHDKTDAPTPFELVPASQRNARLTSLAGTLRNQHLSEEIIFLALKDFAINRCEDGENYFVQEESKIRDLAHRAAQWDAKPLAPLVTCGVNKVLASVNASTPQGYAMTSEEWAAKDFSAEETDSLIGTATNAIIRPLTKNLVLAPDKAFKTTFLMRLMASLAAGVTIFDELPVNKAYKIVYFHAELNPTEIQQRVVASVGGVDPQGRFVHVRDIKTHLIEESGQQFIAEMIVHYKPDVIVLDPWQDLIAGYDENSSKDTSTARLFMSGLIDTFKVTLFLIQHEGKDGSKGGRGHSGMAGWRDTLIRLSRRDGGNLVRVIVEPRWGEKVTLELTLKDGTLAPAITSGFTTQQLNLRAFLKEHPDGATPQHIADGLEITSDACKKMVQRALKDDAVIKNAGGLICLAKKGEN
jgi:hypothetical protein